MFLFSSVLFIPLLALTQWCIAPTQLIAAEVVGCSAASSESEGSAETAIDMTPLDERDFVERTTRIMRTLKKMNAERERAKYIKRVEKGLWLNSNRFFNEVSSFAAALISDDRLFTLFCLNAPYKQLKKLKKTRGISSVHKTRIKAACEALEKQCKDARMHLNMLCSEPSNERNNEESFKKIYEWLHPNSEGFKPVLGLERLTKTVVLLGAAQTSPCRATLEAVEEYRGALERKIMVIEMRDTEKSALADKLKKVLKRAERVAAYLNA